MKLEKICLNITDGVHNSVIDSDDKYYLLSCKNIKDGKIIFDSSDRKIDYETLTRLNKRTKMEQNDIVLSSVGSIGEVAIIKEAPVFEFQRSVAIIKPNTKFIIPKYLLYLFKSQYGQHLIKSRIKGAAQPCLFINDIKDIDINIDSIQTQQHIVDTIGSVDDLIENYQRQIEKLLHLGTLIYLEKISINKRIISISELNIKYGISLPDSKRKRGNFPLLASNGLTDYVSDFFATDAIVFGCRGTLGKVFYQKGKSFVLNTAFYIEKPCNYGNLFFAIKHNKGLTLYSSGAAQPQITIESIKNVKLPTPVDNKLNCILDIISNYQDIVNKLKLIKQLLLNKYFR